MAIINIRNAEVTRTFFGGKGVAIKETFQKSDGTEGASYFTAWFKEDPSLEVGMRGNFSGLHGVKISEYEKDGEMRQSVDVSLNNARFEAAEGGSQGGYDEEAPF